MKKHEKLMKQGAQLLQIVQGEIKADKAEEEVQWSLMLLTYCVALQVLNSSDKKSMYNNVPVEFKEDVTAVLKLIKSNSKEEND